MNVLDDDTLLFFSGHPDALGLYQALETWLYEAFLRPFPMWKSA